MISVHRGASRTDRESQALLGLSTHTSDLSRDQKASTAPPKPQKCKESSAPSYTVISTPYDTAIHVFLTYSNALSFSGTVLRAACLAAELFRRPSQHESPKGDGATGSNTGRRTFVLRQIQTFLEYSWAYSQGLWDSTLSTHTLVAIESAGLAGRALDPPRQESFPDSQPQPLRRWHCSFALEHHLQTHFAGHHSELKRGQRTSWCDDRRHRPLQRHLSG